MAKGRIGMSGSDRGFAQVEKDLRDLKRSGADMSNRAPVTLKEQLEHSKYMSTFEGMYPNYGAWESDVKEECRENRIMLSLISEGGYYPREWKTDGYEKKISPKEFTRFLRSKLDY
jgi:hypothetical protein